MKEKQILSEAYFDSLSIAHKLDNSLDAFERNEIHLFAYFSAILFNYLGNPVEDWMYKFIISSSGYPHSKDLDDAFERNLLSGYFEENGNFLTITSRGTDEFNTFSKYFPTYIKRDTYIDAACSTSILIPYNDTKIALLDDPALKTSLILKNDGWISYNYEKLKEITKAIGAPIDDLLIPAVSWIEYLLKNNDVKG